MKAQKIIAFAASVLMLSACGAPPPKPAPPAPPPPAPTAPKLNMNDARDVVRASSVQRDEYSKTTFYRGPNIAGKPQDQLYIRASKTDFGNIAYQIYIVANYSGVWRFYNQAHDTQGNSLYFTPISRKLNQCQNDDCAHNEFFSIDLTQKQLKEYSQGGLRFRVSGKAGKEEFSIPAGYIEAFLSLSGK